MAERIRVLDSKGRFLRYQNGKWDKNTFLFKEGGIPILSFGAKDRRVALHFENAIEIRRMKEWDTEFDGSDYHEIPRNSALKEAVSSQVVLDAVENERLNRANQLSKPLDFKELIPIFLAIIAVVIAFFAWSTASSVPKLQQNVLQPLNISVHQNAQLEQIIINLTSHDENIQNATLAYLKARGG